MSGLEATPREVEQSISRSPPIAFSCRKPAMNAARPWLLVGSVATPFVGAFAGAMLARLSPVAELHEHARNFDVSCHRASTDTA
jgi:hypothetical protein